MITCSGDDRYLELFLGGCATVSVSFPSRGNRKASCSGRVSHPSLCRQNWILVFECEEEKK